MPKEHELLFSVTSNDLEMQVFRSGGPGGQHQNKTSSGVRFIHHPSGARGESREHREQPRNKRAALERLSKDPRFTYWVHQRVLEIDQKQTAEQWVDEQLADLNNLKVEFLDKNGKWVDWPSDNPV